MIVEDEQSIRALIKLCLQDLDLEFLETASGLEAVQLNRSFRPDLIIMDVILADTGVDGMEASRLIKRNPGTHDSKILLISGMVDLHAEEVKALGIDATLAKPFSTTRLYRMATSLLGLTASKRHGDS